MYIMLNAAIISSHEIFISNWKIQMVSFQNNRMLSVVLRASFCVIYFEFYLEKRICHAIFSVSNTQCYTEILIHSDQLFHSVDMLTENCVFFFGFNRWWLKWNEWIWQTDKNAKGWKCKHEYRKFHFKNQSFQEQTQHCGILAHKRKMVQLNN